MLDDSCVSQLPKYLAIVLTAIVAFTGVVYGYSALNYTVDQHQRQIETLKQNQQSLAQTLQEVHKSLSVTVRVQELMIERLVRLEAEAEGE